MNITWALHDAILFKELAYRLSTSAVFDFLSTAGEDAVPKLPSLPVPSSGDEAHVLMTIGQAEIPDVSHICPLRVDGDCPDFKVFTLLIYQG
ncbi:hypothetical protein BaRGS_00014326 [Batillaria attramentaria]|uniref:Uncharacterized protein n=1 Tax=Batillaria attramentaria TaxID=370345 RepID=A0ABD0L4V2_9CAEN